MHQLGLVLLSNFRCVSLLRLSGGYFFGPNQWRSRTRPASGSKVLLVALTQQTQFPELAPSFVLLAFTSSLSHSLSLFRLSDPFCVSLIQMQTPDSSSDIVWISSSIWLLLLRRARWRIEPLYSVRCVPGTDQTWTPYPGLYYFPLQSTARFFPRRRNSTRTSIWPNTIQSLIKWTSWHTKKSSSCSVCINSPIFYEHDRWKRCSL
jgi:hypothetical protein